MTKPIEQIHAAARDGTSSKLDEIVHLAADHANELGPLLKAITQTRGWYFMDVPVQAVVGVQAAPRDSELTRGFTWRDAALAVEGVDINCREDRTRDWGPEVFDYWSEPIRCRLFPARGAFRHLIMTCYGGAVLVDNGVHRAAAGLVWLLGAGGEGKFLQVPADVREERGERIEFLLELARDGAIEFANLGSLGDYFIGNEAIRLQVAALADVACPIVLRVGPEDREQLWGLPVDGSPARCLSRPSRRRGRASPPLTSSGLSGRWVSVPNEFLCAWRARAWVKESLDDGERQDNGNPCLASSD